MQPGQEVRDLVLQALLRILRHLGGGLGEVQREGLECWITLRTFLQTLSVNQRRAARLSSGRIREEIPHWRPGYSQLTDARHETLLGLSTLHLGGRGEARTAHSEHLRLQNLRSWPGGRNTPELGLQTLRVGILNCAVLVRVVFHAEDPPGVVAQHRNSSGRPRPCKPTNTGPDLSSQLG